MRVTIIAVGSRGDAQPYVALGRGFRDAGHAVTIASHETFRGLVTGRGLAFASLAGDPEAILDSADRWLASGHMSDLASVIRTMKRQVIPLFSELLADYWRVAQGSDLLIYSTVAGPAWSAAERLGIPSVQALLQPLHRTRSFPMIRVPTTLSLGGWFNDATHLATQELAWQLVHGPIDQWRHDTLGLPPAPRRGPFGSTAARAPDPSIYGYSPRVVPTPRDWGPTSMSPDTGRYLRTPPGGRPSRSPHFYRPARHRSMSVSAA